MTPTRKPSAPRPPSTPPPNDPSDPLFGGAPKHDTSTSEAVAAAASQDPRWKRPEETSTALAPSVEKDPGVYVDPAPSGDRTAIVARGPLGDVAEYGKESVAVAAQVKAMVQGRIVQALQRPRSVDDARVAILRDCRRPAFAKAAIYRKPIGGEAVEGLSIRFAESALRHWGNVSSESIILYDDDQKRIVRVSLTDLETNTWHSRDLTILKTVERRTLRRGQQAISQRVNSNGYTVFIVEATEEELSTKEANARSKVLRNEGLRLIPADILDEAKAACKATTTAEVKQDPDAARKAVADAFADLGVMPSDLAAFLGCEIAQASPAQIADLRGWYTAVKDGDATWAEILAARVTDLQPEDDEPQGGAIDKLKAKLQKNGRS